MSKDNLRKQIDESLKTWIEYSKDIATAAALINRKSITNPKKDFDFIWGILQGSVEIFLDGEGITLRTNQPEMKTIMELDYNSQYDRYSFRFHYYFTETAIEDPNLIGKLVAVNRLCRICKKPRDQHKWTGDLGRCPTHWGLYQ